MTARDTGSLPLFQPKVGAIPDMAPADDGKPDLAFETWITAQGCRHVCGTDEAGRGPLAGPVVAAAVVLGEGVHFSGLDDSKRLDEAKRNALFDQIMVQAAHVAICSISAQTIDATDIRKASLEAMRRAIATLPCPVEAALIDGRDIPPGLPPHIVAKAVIKGDQRSQSIAAAAIIAKVTRDRMMVQIDMAFPDWGLGHHMGYGTAAHRGIIALRGGIERVHRTSFAPLKHLRT